MRVPGHTLLSRRDLLRGGAAATVGFVIAFDSEAIGAKGTGAQGKETLLQNWVSVGRDGSITLLTNATEMGQGAQSALAQILAEELEVDWRDVRVDWAPIEPLYYGAWGEFMTGGSGSVRGMFDKLRAAGATARVLLVSAAAHKLGVADEECRAQAGRVHHPKSGRSLSYGELAEAAAVLAAPAAARLKPRAEWQLIGHALPRLDMKAKVTGSAVFGIDVDSPMVNRGRTDAARTLRVATIAQCPAFGGTLRSVDSAPALAVRGVERVVTLDAAVAVVAQDFWTARRGLAALKPVWNPGAKAGMSSEAIADALRKASLEDGKPWVPRGVGEADLRKANDAAFAAAARVIERTYEAPFLAHATLEPMNATAEVANGHATLWLPTQVQSQMKAAVAKALAVEPANVTIHTTLLGGGFGRRLKTDYGVQAALIARKFGGPIKLIWSREEDMQHGFYRPASVIRLRAALSADGRLLALRSNVGCVDSDEPVSGLVDLPYDIPSVLATYAGENPGVPLGAWRSVDPSQNTFAMESFIDELAGELRVTPIALRRMLLKHDARALRVLDAVAGAADKTPPEPGRFRGLAMHRGFGSITAQIAEVSVREKRVKVHRVFAAIDCGTAVNPRNIEGQMQGGIHFGLAAALFGAITLSDGRVQQTNFDSYPLLSMSQAPEVTVTVLESPGEKVGGVGEPPVPPIAPAVCNAIAAATAVRYRSLPLARQGLDVG
jgi:isoquinoline 1-oxidoreductase beta subunit